MRMANRQAFLQVLCFFCFSIAVADPRLTAGPSHSRPNSCDADGLRPSERRSWGAMTTGRANVRSADVRWNPIQGTRQLAGRSLLDMGHDPIKDLRDPVVDLR